MLVTRGPFLMTRATTPRRLTRRLPAALQSLLLGSAAVIATAWTAPVAAQTPGGILEEVVVTARKRDERLQDVPMAITAWNAQRLERLGIRDITDLALQTPGFAMQNQSRQNEQPFLRGMSVNSVFRDRQNASFFVDGVYVAGIGRAIGQDDIERIEVILGPQSAMFGRSTFAGAVNYISKKPVFDTEGMVRGEVGSNGKYAGSASISGPLIGDKLAGRLSVGINRWDGEWRNTLDGKRLGTQEDQRVAASLLYRPTENFDATLRFQFANFNDGNAPTVVLSATNNNCLPSATGAFQFFCGAIPIPTQVSQNLNLIYRGGFRRVDDYRGQLTMNWTFGGWKITSVSAYNYGRQGLASDGDGSPVNALGGALNTYFFTRFRDYVQDLRVTSPAEDRFRIMAGASYFGSLRLESQQRLPTFSSGPATLVRTPSVYGQASYDILPNLTASLEARWQSEKVSLEATPTSTTFRAFLPRAVVNWKVTEDAMLYTSASKGNKPGFFNTAVGTPRDLRDVKEETMWAYELGAKTQWLDKRLTLNGAAYYINWTNQGYQDTVLQRDANNNLILAPNGVPRTVVLTINVGKTEVKGIELDGGFQITPEWSVRAAYAWTEAKYKTFLSNLPLTYGGNRSVAGKYLQNTPIHKLTLSTQYITPLAMWPGYDLVMGADYSYRDKQYLDELNTSWVKPLHLLNARIGVENATWALQIYGRNLFDSDVPDFATRTTDFAAVPNRNSYTVTLRQSANFGAIATYRF